MYGFIFLAPEGASINIIELGKMPIGKQLM